MNDKVDKITEAINKALDECENISQQIMLLSYVQSMIDYLLKDFVKTAYDMENSKIKEDEIF